MGLNHQLDGQDGSKSITKNSELIKGSKKHPNDPFGPTNQAQLSPSQVHDGCLDLVHVHAPLTGFTGTKHGAHSSSNVARPTSFKKMQVS